jgi:cytidylate kinase
MIIAVDGTMSSGKGTLARRLAGHFGLPHLDTGLLYRAVGLQLLREGVDLSDEGAFEKLVYERGWNFDLKRFAEWELRTAEAGAAASRVAAWPLVRKMLLQAQRDFARQPGGAVLDGRDIGTVIAPDADVKFWVDADVEVRAGRRTKELNAAGQPITHDQMIAHLKERDARDAGRSDAPMKPADDAVFLDTTAMSIEEVVAAAVKAVEARRRPS